LNIMAIRVSQLTSAISRKRVVVLSRFETVARLNKQMAATKGTKAYRIMKLNTDARLLNVSTYQTALISKIIASILNITKTLRSIWVGFSCFCFVLILASYSSPKNYGKSGR